MKLTSAIALMLGLWMFSSWGWETTQAAEPSLGSSFKEWCQKRTSLSAQRRKTVEELLKEAGTSDCELAAKDLSSRTVLSLPEAPITDLRPLAGLTNLKDLYLTLAELTNLRLLNLTGNPLAEQTCPLPGSRTFCDFENSPWVH